MRIVVCSFFSCLSLAAQASWTQLYPSQNPPLRAGSMFGSHEASGQCLSVFGRDALSGSFTTQIWRLQGSTWSTLTGAAPPPRIQGALAYDSLHQRLVLFGGVDAAQQGLDDTWLWNGTSWSSAVVAVRPPARTTAAMAFDRDRGVVVLLGGESIATPGTYFADVWQWNGSAWQQSPVSLPSARARAMLAYDPVGGGLLLHGGLGPGGQSGTLLNDTMTFTGALWIVRQPATPPPWRMFGCMVTDPLRQRVVLLGGGVDPFPWEWNGSEWNPMVQPSPALRSYAGIAYDAVQRRVVLHGGLAIGPFGSYALNDTWSFATPLPADVAPFGVGCAGTAGTPALAAKPFALPWLGDTMRNVVQTVPAASLGAFFVSSFGSTPPLSLAAFGMPGCDLLVPVDVAEFRVATAGSAEWELAIPNTPSLAAAQFRQQAFVIDAPANALGLVASNGVTVTLGVR